MPICQSDLYLYLRILLQGLSCWISLPVLSFITPVRPKTGTAGLIIVPFSQYYLVDLKSALSEEQTWLWPFQRWDIRRD